MAALRRTLVRAATASGLMLVTPLASAATRTWTGTVSGLWSDAANWGGSTPVAGDDLVFPAGAQTLSTTNDLPAGTAFGTITIAGGGYSLGGNELALGGDIFISVPSAGPVIAMPLVLTRSVTITNDSAPNVTAKLLASSTIDLGTYDLTVNGAAKTSIAGVISGSGSLSRTSGNGEIALSGDNTFTGPVKIGSGTLTVQSNTALGDPATGTTVEGTGKLRISAAAPLVIAEPLMLGSMLYGHTGTATWTGAIALTADSEVGANDELTISGAVSGPYALSKGGLGNVTLTAANTYHEGTTVRSGTLTVAGPWALGAGPIRTWLAARLVVANGTYSNALSIQGSTFPKGGLESRNGTTTWAGPITLESPDSALETTGTLVVSGALSGWGGLVKRGAGEVKLTASSTYASGTEIVAGTLRCASADAIPDLSIVTIDDGGTLLLDPQRSEEIGGLSGQGRVILGAGSKLTTGGGNKVTGFYGAIEGTGSVTFTGTADKYLGGTHTYSGPTTVQAGSLLVSGTLLSASTVKAGARMGLYYGGSVGPIISTGGAVAPGFHVARYGSTQTLVLDSASRFDVELDATSPDDYSKLFVATATILGDATLKVKLNFKPAIGDTFVIVHDDFTGPVSGQFKGLPEGAVFAQDGSYFQITYAGGDGNDIVLTAVLAAPDDAGTDAGYDAGELDASTIDASDGGSRDADDVSVRDAGALADATDDVTGEGLGSAPTSPEVTGCDCRAAAPRFAPVRGIVALAALAAAWISRRRRR